MNYDIKWFLCFIFIVFSAKQSIGQTPVIRPNAYVIKIESSFPYVFASPTTANVYKIRREFSIFDSLGTLVAFYESDQPGYVVNEFFATGDAKPSFFKGFYKIDSLVQIVVEDPDCNPNNTNYTCACKVTKFCGNSLFTLANGNRTPLNIPGWQLTYPSMDQTFVGQSSSDKVRVVVGLSGDGNYNLPSHDQISIGVENQQPGYKWQYEVLDSLGNGVWKDVPANLQYATKIVISGSTLFDTSWSTYLNRTVLFRLFKSVGVTSNVLVYTHRLSSPKILATSVKNNRCYGMDSASVSIQFSRPLLANEKLNIFLKDSATGADYSAVNLTNANLDSDNKYTWNNELIKGSYIISLIGKHNGFATYTGSVDHIRKVNIKDPPLLSYTTDQESATCFGGSNGVLLLKAKGGTGALNGLGDYKYQTADSTFDNVWHTFTSPVILSDGSQQKTIGGLYSKEYKIRIRDAQDCKVVDSLNNEIIRVQKVYQPLHPLQMPYFVTSPVTSYNASNGSITIQLSGGVPFAAPEIPGTYKKYEFEWRDSATNKVITNFTLDTIGKYQTSIQNLPAGTYRFIAWDRNYNTSYNGNQQGCRIDIYIQLKNPDPLSINIATAKKISCNGGSDGVLWAKARGGIPVSDSLRYNFTWYKWAGSSYVKLSTVDSMLSNQAAGQYYVEIRDKYANVKASSAFTLNAPSSVAATTATSASTCYFTANGSMQVSVSGGTPPYRYEWSNGTLTPQVNNIAGGTYYVVVRDSSFCEVTKQVIVTSPNKINTVATVTQVACFNGNNGKIALNATGGTGTLTYLWSNGTSASSLNNLSAGKYWYRITDTKGCYDTDTVVLDNPDNYAVNAGVDRKICTNQMISLTPTIISGLQSPIPTIRWSTPRGMKDSLTIRTATPGTYIVQALNSRGCIKADTMLMTSVNATVNTNFTVSTQAFAGDNTTLVNISPQLQDSVRWQLPNNMSYQLISQSKQYCELKIVDTGMFQVGMKAFYANGCIDELYKPVNVVRTMSPNSPGNQADAFLKQMSIAPNPTSGSFTLNLLFNAVTQARVRIVNVLTNVSIDTRLLNGAASYSQQYNIGVQPQGIYIILIETMKGNFIYKLNKL